MLDETKKYAVSDLKGDQVSKLLALPKKGRSRILNVKDVLEQELDVIIDVDEGKIKITTDKENVEKLIKGEEVLEAVRWGFPPEEALKLRETEYDIQKIDLKKYRGDLRTIKGRVIGREGKTKKRIANVTKTSIIITERYAIVLGKFGNIDLAVSAIKRIASGQRQQDVYNYLHSEKRRRRWT